MTSDQGKAACHGQHLSEVVACCHHTPPSSSHPGCPSPDSLTSHHTLHERPSPPIISALTKVTHHGTAKVPTVPSQALGERKSRFRHLHRSCSTPAEEKQDTRLDLHAAWPAAAFL